MPSVPQKDDPWAASPHAPASRSWSQRGRELAQRGVGLATLLLLSVLGAAVLVVALILLGIAFANGQGWAGWLLLLTLAAGLGAGWWVTRQIFMLLGVRKAAVPAPPTRPIPTALDDETRLLHFWQKHQASVSGLLSPALQSTVLATRDALRALERNGSATLSRELFDTRQAIREDLPELLDAYRSVPPSRQSDAQLLDNLATIEKRMRGILEAQREAQARELSAAGSYLKDKYTPAASTLEAEGLERVEPLPEPEKVRVR